MEVGNWMTLFAVIVALGIGVASILHTRSLQKKERRQRLLNEIIEWAMNISKCGIREDIAFYIDEIPEDVANTSFGTYLQSRKVEQLYYGQLLSSYLIFKEQSEYIKIIANEFKNSLDERTIEVEKALNHQIKLLRNGITKQASITMTTINRHRAEVLKKATQKVIEQATKIKTKNIS